MCGRFGLTRPDRLDLKRFGVGLWPPAAPRFNIAPGSEVLAVRVRKGERVADFLRWGLVPSWADDPAVGHRHANARGDTAFDRPSFREAIRARRCLIPADVFYEWKELPGTRRKQPYAVRMKDGDAFALGGIWDYWRSADRAVEVASCAILTTEPNTLLMGIHDRMPVIVPPERYRAWLDDTSPDPLVRDILRPYPADSMEAWPVSRKVNDAKVDSPVVLEREGDEQEGLF